MIFKMNISYCTIDSTMLISVKNVPYHLRVTDFIWLRPRIQYAHCIVYIKSVCFFCPVTISFMQRKRCAEGNAKFKSKQPIFLTFNTSASIFPSLYNWCTFVCIFAISYIAYISIFHYFFCWRCRRRRHRRQRVFVCLSECNAYNWVKSLNQNEQATDAIEYEIFWGISNE